MYKVYSKLINYYKVGGIKYVLIKFVDTLSHSNKGRLVLYKQLEKLPPNEYRIMLSKTYKAVTGKTLNLENPQTFNEKIQWLKLYDSTPLKSRLSDKYEVRQWITEKIGNGYLIPIYGVYDSIEQINLENLPSQFVLKATHGSGWNIIVEDKGSADWDFINAQFNKWLWLNYAFMSGLELQYASIIPRIIAEKYVEEADGNLHDYKIHCFNGEPIYIQVIGNRDTRKHFAYEAFYDTDWTLQPFTYTYRQYEKPIKKPKCLEQMLYIARKLSEEFIYVRVDLYVLDDDNIKFGEMTFTPASGFDRWTPDEYDKKLGELLQLPNRVNKI